MISPALRLTIQGMTKHAAPYDALSRHLLAPDRPVAPEAEKAFRFLEDLIRPGLKFELAKIRRLLGRLGDPHRAMPWIQVVGTNGKGSVSATLHAVLRLERRTGLFTSPHLVSFRERIRVDERPIPVADFARCGEAVMAAIASDEWLAAEPPSFFEAGFAMACLHFRDQEVEIAVAEAGLGGRLDATTVTDPGVTAITNVGWDHEKILGSTLEAILAEKIAVARPGVPFVSGLAPGPLEDRARAHCQRVGAPFHAVPAPEDVQVEKNGTRFTHRGLPRRTGLVGAHQAANAAVTLDVLAHLPPALAPSDRAIEAGLARVRWPARFQQLPSGVIVDGGHNPDGMAAMVRTLRGLHGDRVSAIVVGFSGDKRLDEMIGELARLDGPIVLTQSRHWRAADPLATERRLRELLPGREVTVVTEGPRAVEHALALRQPERPILLTGSLYLIGEIFGSGVLGNVDQLLGMELGPYA